ncbi:MAG TPA: hypothetical protein VNB24_07520 [Acidimicrobiales bacterium]|nr:hypothetical protein [Acidimicrobiales bacterium]
MHRPAGPTFAVIGAAKAATSSMYEYLRAHPEVFMSPVKETNFFALNGAPPSFRGPGDDAGINRHSIWRAEDYAALFSGAGMAPSVRARGEASPLYLYDEHAPVAVAAHGGIKAVAILRHPVERAYAAWLHKRRDGLEPLDDFASALNEERARRAAGWEFVWHYEAVGHYPEQLQRWFTAVGRENVYVLLQEDLEGAGADVLARVFDFIGVDSSFEVDTSQRYNPSGEVRSAALQQALTHGRGVRALARRLVPAGARERVHRRLSAANLRKPEMSAATRADLLARYAADVDVLESMLNRDLGSWRV